MSTIPWLGEVRYPTSAAKRAYSIVLGKMLQTAPVSADDREVPYLKSASVQWSGVVADLDVTMWASGSECRDLRVDKGDLLICEGGDVGRCAFYEGPNGFIFQNSVHRARGLGGNDIRYFNYVLEALHGSAWLDVLCNKATIRHLTGDKLGALDIPLPSLEEQRRIANFLDGETAFLDRIKLLRSQQRLQLVQRRWSMLQDTLDRRKIDILPLRRLLYSVVDGPFGSAFSSSDYVDDGAAVVRLGNIGFCEYRHEDQARIPMALYREFRRYEVQEGDVLIAGLGDPRNHAGRACIAPSLGPAIVKGKCFRARVDEKVASAEYLALILSSSLGASALEGRGSTRSMINLEILKSAMLPIPSYADQVVIAREVNSHWQSELAAVKACDRQLDLLSERRQALVTAAVTGQIDVTTARRLPLAGGAVR